MIEAFLCLVVKLSEASFRPMFLRVRKNVSELKEISLNGKYLNLIWCGIRSVDFSAVLFVYLMLAIRS